jgi:hypothetical protein
LHGFFLACERLFIFGNKAISKRMRVRSFKGLLKTLLSILLVFHLVTLGWVVFRSESIGAALVFLGRLFSAGGWQVPRRALLLLALGYCTTFVVNVIEYRRNDEWVFRSITPWLRGVAYAAAVAYIVFIGGSGGKVSFIYFQF